MKPEPKISIPEGIIGIFVLLIADGVELALLFAGLDDFWISDAIAFPLTQLYLRMKGLKGTASLVANILELIPYVGWLPLRTIGFVIVLYMDHHPKLAAVTMRAAIVKGRGASAAISKSPAAAPEGRAKVIAQRKQAVTNKFRGGKAATYGKDGESWEELGMPGDPLEEIRKTMEAVPTFAEHKNTLYDEGEKAPIAMEDIRPAVDKEEKKELL